MAIMDSSTVMSVPVPGDSAVSQIESGLQFTSDVQTVWLSPLPTAALSGTRIWYGLDMKRWGLAANKPSFRVLDFPGVNEEDSQSCRKMEGVQPCEPRVRGDIKSALTFGGLNHCAPGNQNRTIEGNM